ncbi:ABC transporter substrate-binding protein [Bacillus solitudinis]|uniref:ABC transporter substrate-binding protein n=1 Tax=Bacillus solitudinis TaxID=2014074 RepID=UPI000C24DC75|nr:ABC transporter substrate-binding protein [Bacillus solitudinis]
MKQVKFWLMALFVAIFMVACGTTSEDAGQVADENQADQVEETDTIEMEEPENLYPLTMQDALGDEVTIEAKPERMVSLIPSITETIFALEQGEYVVGRTDWDNYPEEVNEIETVGGMDFDIEKVISLNPDLVLTHESGAHSTADGMEQLRQAGITVLVVNSAETIEEVYESINLVGQATASQSKADELIEKMRATMEEFEKKASEIPEEDRMKVWVEISPDLYTSGQGTFMHEMITILNATNAAEEQQGWVQFTEEEAVAFNADVIITTYGGYEEEHPSETIKQRSAWKDIPAVVNERIYDVDPDTVTRPGPRLAEGVEHLAAAIYPEVFGE